MADWGGFALAPLELITPWSLESIGPGLVTIGTNGRMIQAASATFPSANTAYFYPFSLGTVTDVTKLFIYNGATVSGNFDLGIYSEGGVMLVSTGSTAQSGTSTLQVVDTTDVIMGPGTFYLAVVLNNTTGTVFRTVPVGTPQFISLLGVAQMASAFPLPATATLAALATDTVLAFGAATRVIV